MTEIKNKDVVGKFIMIKDIMFSDYMKDKDGLIKLFDSEQEALETAGMYEFPDVIILEVKSNYVEPEF